MEGGDEYIYEFINNHEDLSSSEEFNKMVEQFKKNAEKYELEIIDKRYEFVNSITNEGGVKRPDVMEETMTDKIDKILTHKYLGLPIFALIMLIVFQLTFAIGEDY